MNKTAELRKKIILLALDEDEFSEDVTTNSLADFDSVITAVVIAGEDGVISGTEMFSAVFAEVDPGVKLEIIKKDGDSVQKGDIVIRMKGSEASILRGERTALNFIQRLSGIATLTRRYSTLLKGSAITLLDTRKTTPGMRYPEKKAVKDGGGANHRMNLKEMAMIKDNHIRMAGSISGAVRAVRKNSPPGTRIEVEVTSIRELKQALNEKVDIIMLDNFNPDLLDEAVQLKEEGVKYEISGNVNLDNIRSKIHKGIDYISSGALTHSFKSLDLSLELNDKR